MILLATHTMPWISRLSPPPAPVAPGGGPGLVNRPPAEPESAPPVADGGDSSSFPTPEMPPAKIAPTVPPVAVAKRSTAEPDDLAAVVGGRGDAASSRRGGGLAAAAPLGGDFADIVKKALAEHRRQSGARRRSPAGGAESDITATGELVALVQQRLRERGYDPGSVDGSAGPQTRAAIRAFQRNTNGKPDGQISLALLQNLGVLGQAIHAFHDDGMPTASR